MDTQAKLRVSKRETVVHREWMFWKISKTFKKGLYQGLLQEVLQYFSDQLFSGRLTRCQQPKDWKNVSEGNTGTEWVKGIIKDTS